VEVRAVSVAAYPLQREEGWKRASWRQRAAFGQQGARGWKEALTVAKARQRLSDELDRLGATYVTLSTNIELRLDGQPRSNQAEPGDPGVAAYFRLGGKQIALACDKWDRVADNIAALAKHIEAMRGMDRWGVGTAAQAFAGYEALPAPDPWWKVLGMDGPTAEERFIRDAYRKVSAAAHPDRPGGSHDRMAAINAARDEGLRRIGALERA
jgi:hypothetical protein